MHYAATAALVLAAYAARVALDGVYHPPFLTFIPVVLAASLLLDRGSGLLATVLSAALAHRFLVHPGDGPGLGGGNAAVALAAFVAFGLFTAALIEALRAAVDRLVEAERRARATEARTAALLDEMNHRFKNGLHAVGGILLAEGRRMPDPAARAALEDAAGRLRVLGRLHDRLHLLGGPAGGPVEMRGFLDALCADLRATLAEGRPVAVRACADRINLETAQAVPVGLIVNEAVTNALKHAFPGERRGTVSVRLRRHGERGLRLEVADDGVGFPGGDPGAAGGGGTRLVRVLARQLGGDAAWRAARPGTAVAVAFPEAPTV